MTIPRHRNDNAASAVRSRSVLKGKDKGNPMGLWTLGDILKVMCV
jgi:hypothetical protein